jgi:hypothetical protein
MDYQHKLARFLENHDEPRAAAEFPPNMHEAAAIITFLSPGLRFFHQGQFQGRKKRISPHLCRGPEEPANENLEKFYQKLLSILRGRYSEAENDNCWNPCLPGTETGLMTVMFLLCGKESMERKSWSQQTMPRIRARVM